MDAPLLKLEYMMLPFAFHYTVAVAKTVDPSALLAGGALRDFLNRRDIKDLDIFIGPTEEINPLGRLNDAYHVKGRMTVGTSATEYLSMADVQAVYEHVVMGVGVINTVVLKQPMTIAERLNRFDFGICQVGFDGVDVWATPAFHQDRKNETFTLVRCDTDSDYFRSMVRYERLVEKYPHWQLVLGADAAEFKAQIEQDEIWELGA